MMCILFIPYDSMRVVVVRLQTLVILICYLVFFCSSAKVGQ